GADLAIKEAMQRHIDDASAAENGGEHAEGDAKIAQGGELFGPGLKDGPAHPVAELGPQIESHQCREEPRHEVERQIAFLGESRIGMRDFTMHEACSTIDEKNAFRRLG